MILNVRVKKMNFSSEEKREQGVIVNLISHLYQKINLSKLNLRLTSKNIYLFAGQESSFCQAGLKLHSTVFERRLYLRSMVVLWGLYKNKRFYWVTFSAVLKVKASSDQTEVMWGLFFSLQSPHEGINYR